MSTSGLHVVGVWGRTSLFVAEQAGGDANRTFELSVDGIVRATLTFPRWGIPGLTMTETRAIIWGDRIMAALDLQSGQVRQHQFKEPIARVYPATDRWCIVFELSIMLISPETWQPTATYDHGEVLMRTWWHADVLYAEDFYGRRLAFRPGASALTPLSDGAA